MVLDKDEKEDVLSAPGWLPESLDFVTLCTYDIHATQAFFSGQLGVQLEGPFDRETYAAYKNKALFGLPEVAKYDVYKVAGGEKAKDLRIRVIAIEPPDSNDEQSSKATPPNPSTLGVLFTKEGQLFDDQLLGANKSGRYNAKAQFLTNDTPIPAREWYLKPPDQVIFRLVEIDDEQNTISNKASDATCQLFTTYLTEDLEGEAEFYKRVLGMQVIQHHQMSAGRNNAFMMTEGQHYQRMRLSHVSPLANFIELIQPDTTQPIEKSVQQIPKPGSLIWSFQTKDIGEILARAHAREIKLFQTPRKVHDPVYGTAIALTLFSPSGKMIEVYNPV